MIMALPPAVVAVEEESIPPFELKVTEVPSVTGVPSVFLTVAVTVTVCGTERLTMVGDTATVTVDGKVTWTVTEARPEATVMVNRPPLVLVKLTLAFPPVVVAVEEERVPPVPLVMVKLTVVPSGTAVPSDFFGVAVMATEVPIVVGAAGFAAAVIVVAAFGSAAGNHWTPLHPVIIAQSPIKIIFFSMNPPEAGYLLGGIMKQT